VDALLAFAARSRLPVGLGCLLAEGTTDRSRPLETWVNARMTHVFGLAALAGHDTGELVEHGLRALGGPLHDAAHGGWRRAAGDGTKTAYDHAFVLLAGSTAAACGAGEQLLDEALQVWDQRFWDDAAGAAVDEWNVDWTQLDGYRGANANMHGVEALLAAADARPAVADVLLSRALRVVDRLVHHEARSRGWRLPEHYDEHWSAQLEHNADQRDDPFRPFGVTVGHQFEWARLAVHLETAIAATRTDAPAWLLPDATELYDAACRHGWAADGFPGFPYTLDWDDRPVVAARMHWVLAEAVSAAHVLAARTGKERYRRDAQRWLALAEERFLDPATGNWHHELTPEGAVASATWHGQPDAYHVLQSMLLADLPLAGSLAAALRRRPRR
jgi:mannose/cellobiose epimerase-like protein (N-acyl-D-glucosamine 2-epimerase family)